MSNSNPYFDKYGLLYIEKNTITENGIYYRAQLDNWSRIFHKSHAKSNPNYDPYESGWQKAIASAIIERNNYQSNPPENGPDFSRNNMLGLYALCKIHKMKKTIKQLPLMVWNEYKWYNPKHWHPKTWAVFLAFKYPIFKLNPVIYIMALYSLLKTDYKNTSEKNLWFLTLTALKIEWPLIWAQKRFAKKSYMSRNGYNLFEYSYKHYFSGGMKFNNPDNPLRVLTDLYYKIERKY